MRYFKLYNTIIKGKGLLPFYLFTLLPFLASCSLDEHPRDQIAEGEAYTSADALYRNTVATLYNYIGGYEDGQGLQGTCRGVYDLQTFGSDEAMLPLRGGDWFDGGLWQAMYYHSWDAGHDLPKNAWLYLYKVITLCNNSLTKLDEHKALAAGNYQRWQAEVRALRAMYYWYLIDLFGDVPLVTTVDISMNEVERTPRGEVFSFCVKELQEAAPELAQERSNLEGDYYGRITQPVCHFVLCKLMLNAEVYTGTPRYAECIGYCDALELAGYRLESAYDANFAVYNQTSAENIFTIPMDKNLYSNQQQNITRSLHYRHAAAYGYTGENGSSATPQVLQVFGYGTDSVDARFSSCYYADTVRNLAGQAVTDRSGLPLVYLPEKVAIDLSGTPYVETGGARMRKYEIDKNAPKDGKLMDNDIVLFRYADVLLMRAEARMRLGQDGHADYNAVRLRAGMPTRPCTLQNIENERLLELCWEGWRRQDMIRFGHYHSLATDHPAIDESDGHTRLFPIPADVRALNNNLTQNEGY